MFQIVMTMFAMCATPIGGPTQVLDACNVDGSCICAPMVTQIASKPSIWKACEEANKNLYRTQNDTHIFAIGECRLQQGDTVNRD